MKIGTKIFLSTGGLLVLVMVAQAMTAHFMVSGEMEKNVNEAMQENSKNQAAVFSALLAQTDQDMQVFSALKSLEDYFTSRIFEDTDSMSEAAGNLEAFLKHITEAKPQYVTIQIVTAKEEPVLQISNGERVESFDPFEHAAALVHLESAGEKNGGEEVTLHHVRSDNQKGWVLESVRSLVVDGQTEGLLWAVQSLKQLLEDAVSLDHLKMAVVIADRNGQVVSQTGNMETEAVQGFVDGKAKGWITASRSLEEFGWVLTIGKKEADANVVLNKLAVAGTFTLVFSLLVAGGILWFIVRGITGPVNLVIDSLTGVADQVTRSSAQLSDASHQLAEGASEQSASVEETSASLEEISATTRGNAENASEGDSLMTEVKDLVERANASMLAQNESMEGISRASEETSKIIKTIDEIAFQTNLLALNAAVEAARAGEAGAGFAVVADEVRNLAMRAAEAAKETASRIEGTVDKISQGSELALKSTTEFAEVSDIVSRVDVIVADIANASREQNTGIEQVKLAVNEIEKVTQSNAAHSEETASASEEMISQSQHLSGCVVELAQMVGKKETSRAGESEEEIPLLDSP